MSAAPGDPVPTMGVLVPAFGAESTVAGVVRAVLEQGLPVLVVDDGSLDSTSEKAREAGASVLRLERNSGKGTALHVGITEAQRRGWTWVVAMDADGQHAPESLADFRNHLGSDAGVVVGARRLETDVMPWPRVCSNRMTTALLSWQAGCRLWDSQCGYRMLRVQAAMTSRLPDEGRFEWESEALVRIARKGWRIDRIEVPTLYGDETSHIRPWRDTSRFIRLWFRLWGLILAGKL